MIQKITSLWPNLVRRAGIASGRGTEQEEEQQLLDRDGRRRDDEVNRIDEEQLLADYRLLNWTRLMQVENYEPDLERKWPLGPDIVEECQAVANLPDTGIEDWAPLFEPTDFNSEHGQLEIEAYRLSHEELR